MVKGVIDLTSVFTDDNPTRMYLNTLASVLSDGDECAPRGKRILEVRPAVLEFTNPLNRITFLRGRRVNPFFNVAECLWIASGRADVGWLSMFNANMHQFSDDGVWFNAPYGERLRAYGKNAAHNFIFNPIDQMSDAFTKLTADIDTRQAVMTISNPMFDHSGYTLGEHGKDVPCNLVITFKIRGNDTEGRHLHMTVFNRSNDIHWGVFGANLAQFSTLQELMLSWMKAYGEEHDLPAYEKLRIGTYTQITDSLHLYVEDYGAGATAQVMNAYGISVPGINVKGELTTATRSKVYSSAEVEDAIKDCGITFEMLHEPRMSMSKQGFESFLQRFWSGLNPFLENDEFLGSTASVERILAILTTFPCDDYWGEVVKHLFAYRYIKLCYMEYAMQVLKSCKSSQWLVSMMYFTKRFIGKMEASPEKDRVIAMYHEIVQQLAIDLRFQSNANTLRNYLALDGME